MEEKTRDKSIMIGKDIDFIRSNTDFDMGIDFVYIRSLGDKNYYELEVHGTSKKMGILYIDNNNRIYIKYAKLSGGYGEKEIKKFRG